MIYRYKATLPNNKIFMREYAIKSEMKLYKLHEFIQNDLGFAPDQMVEFEGVDKDGTILHEYGLFDMGDGSMDTVTIEKTLKRGEVVLHYIYNLKKNIYIILTYLSEDELNPRESYPLTLAEKGRNPDQFSTRYDDFEAGGGALSADSVPDDDEDFDESELPEGEE